MKTTKYIEKNTRRRKMSGGKDLPMDGSLKLRATVHSGLVDIIEKTESNPWRAKAELPVRNNNSS